MKQVKKQNSQHFHSWHIAKMLKDFRIKN